MLSSREGTPEADAPPPEAPEQGGESAAAAGGTTDEAAVPAAGAADSTAATKTTTKKKKKPLDKIAAAKAAELKGAMSRMKDRLFVESAGEGNYAQTERLLQCGQDVDAMHPELSYSALHGAADFGWLNIVQLLLANGAEVDIRRPATGETPLMHACLAGRWEICDVLLRAGANKLLQNREGATPLILATDMQRADIANRLRDPPDVPRCLEVCSVGLKDFHVRWGPQRDNGAPVDFCELQWRWLWARRVEPWSPEPPFLGAAFGDDESCRGPKWLSAGQLETALQTLAAPPPAPPLRGWNGARRTEAELAAAKAALLLPPTRPGAAAAWAREEEKAAHQASEQNVGWLSSGPVEHKLMTRMQGGLARLVNAEEDSEFTVGPPWVFVDPDEAIAYNRAGGAEGVVEAPKQHPMGHAWVTDDGAAVDGLEPAAVYAVRLRAHNMAGYSEWGEEWRVCTDPVKCGIVSPPVCLSKTATSISLSWEVLGSCGGRPITTYELQYAVVDQRAAIDATVGQKSVNKLAIAVAGGGEGGGGEGGSGSGSDDDEESSEEDEPELEWQLLSAALDVPRFIARGLQPGFSYMFRARCRTALGWGPRSDLPPLGRPSAVMTTMDAPFPTAVTVSSITIEWLPITTASGLKMDKYELQIAAIDVPPDPLGEMMDAYVRALARHD